MYSDHKHYCYHCWDYGCATRFLMHSMHFHVTVQTWLDLTAFRQAPPKPGQCSQIVHENMSCLQDYSLYCTMSSCMQELYFPWKCSIHKFQNTISAPSSSPPPPPPITTTKKNYLQFIYTVDEVTRGVLLMPSFILIFLVGISQLEVS